MIACRTAYRHAQAAQARDSRDRGTDHRYSPEDVRQDHDYRIHLDAVSPETRIEVITEAILTRRIQNVRRFQASPSSLLTSFTSARFTQISRARASSRDRHAREDLFVIVMSATIDTAKIMTYLDRFRHGGSRKALSRKHRISGRTMRQRPFAVPGMAATLLRTE